MQIKSEGYLFVDGQITQLVSQVDCTTWHFFERVRIFSEDVYQKGAISQAHVQERVLQTTISLFMEPFDILNKHPTADNQITQHHYFFDAYLCICLQGWHQFL